MSDNDFPPLDSQAGTPQDSGSEAVAVDSETLELLLHVLRQEGYETASATADDVQVVLGENLDNVIVATATMTATDLVRAEPVLSNYLVERLGTANADGKRWDGYVVLLTTQPAGLDYGEPLFGLTYNLRHVRRLVKVGVQATVADVRRALRPLLPLTDSTIVDTISDPLSALALRLEADGVDPTSVHRAIARFKADHSMGFVIDENLPPIETESVYGETFDD